MKMQLFNHRFYLCGTTSLKYYRDLFNNYKFDDNIEIVDPLIEVEPKFKNKPELYDELVQSDLSLLHSCYGLIAKINTYTAGSIGELISAYNSNKLTLLISEDEKIINDPWIKHFTKYHFYTCEECIKYLSNTYGNRT